MIPTRLLRKSHGRAVSFGVKALAALILLVALLAWGAQNPAPPEEGKNSPHPPEVTVQAATTAPKPKDMSSLEKTRSDAAALSALADQLRDELDKMNVHVLPLDVVRKTEQLEKLAKKIKGEAGAP